MNRKIPASEYMGYDKYIGDECIVKKNPNIIEIPENATNGDVIKAVFDVTEVRQLDWCTFVDTSDDAIMRTYKDWWNKPYKGR